MLGPVLVDAVGDQLRRALIEVVPQAPEHLGFGHENQAVERAGIALLLQKLAYFLGKPLRMLFRLAGLRISLMLTGTGAVHDLTLAAGAQLARVSLRFGMT